MVYGCAATHTIWPQKDVGFHEINRADLDKRVLIASQESEFKRTIIDRITNEYKSQPVYLKIIGIADLPLEDAYQYSAVVLINACMAWTIDRTVKQFLETYGDLPSIIVLTTSGSGDVFAKLENRQIDAISSASVKEDADPVARKLIVKIKRHLSILHEPFRHRLTLCASGSAGRDAWRHYPWKRTALRR